MTPRSVCRRHGSIPMALLSLATVCGFATASLGKEPIVRAGIFEPAGRGFNTSTSDNWLLISNVYIGFYYGALGDIPVVGNWTGLGSYPGIGVFRPSGTQFNHTGSGEWLLRNQQNSGDPQISFYYGCGSDMPVVGDWTGNGTTTIGVYRPPGAPCNYSVQGEWLLRYSNSAGAPDKIIYYGGPGDIPVVGDWTGNGVTTIGVFRPPGTQYNHTNDDMWLLRYSNTAGNPDNVIAYGAKGDIPVVGNWSDCYPAVPGKTTIGVVRPPGTQYNNTSKSQWLLRCKNAAGPPDVNFYFGDKASVPIVGFWAPGNG
jgi:hypothetical protein